MWILHFVANYYKQFKIVDTLITMFIKLDSAILDILGCMVYQWYVSNSESHRQKIF